MTKQTIKGEGAENLAGNLLNDLLENRTKPIPTGLDKIEPVRFPTINKNLPIEKLAEIYRDIEEGKDIIDINSRIETPPSCNVIPSSKKGNCEDILIGIIIDETDFERRMPHILAHHIRCKHKKVILAAYYWDGTAWETTWKEPFKAVGGEVYRQMYDEMPVRIL
ncbi:Uncharacterised protein [uncultured archaeon]|nr:Uncharacterised protein [uncultured archaeon]